ncbi:MAG: thioredoxin [Alphaproteobacteria bacterium]|nr:thioredoxin [Alphaproteobacteria bacterium]MCB9928191.1 thioredoxin [Alphaproteobacteria bacterium]
MLEAQPAGAGLIKDGTDQSFMADVVDASQDVPVIVDFWAPWCGPCKQLGPTLEKVVTGAGGKVKLVKVDIDQNPMVAQQLRIQSIPAVYAFKGGRPVDAFMGALPESQVKSFVEKLVGDSVDSPVEQAIAQAKELLEAGDLDNAGAIFSQVLQHEAENVIAKAGLVLVLVEKDEIATARELLDQIPANERRDAFVAGAVSAVELAEQSGDSGDLGELQQAVQADPDDHQARFDLAMALFGARQHQDAAEALLEIVRRDRTWNDDGARQQLVKFFEAWGPTDPLTVQTRRRLSSLLFS